MANTTKSSITTSFSTESMKELMTHAQKNLDALAEKHQLVIHASKPTADLVTQRDNEIKAITQRYDNRIQESNKNLPELREIYEEVLRQINSLQGFRDTLEMLNVNISGLAITMPPEFEFLVSGVAPIPQAPRPTIQHRTIEQSVRQVLSETRIPMRPRDIIAKIHEYGGYQSEASIRTQLHNMKKQGTLDYDLNLKTYSMK